MWFVMEESTEKTLATTAFQDVANMIATSMPMRCIIRFAPTNLGQSSEKNFFEKVEKSA